MHEVQRCIILIVLIKGNELTPAGHGFMSKEVVKTASGSTSATGTAGYTEDLRDQTHAKEA